MSAIQRSILALALMLIVVMSSSTPAAAQVPRGIWVDLSEHVGHGAWTLTVINLTNSPLELLTNSVSASGAQRPPFHGTTLNEENAIPPYRNVTWKSNTSTLLYPVPHWNGTLTFLPQTMGQQWTVTLNFDDWWPIGEGANEGGTWVYLTAATNNWLQVAPDNESCSYTSFYSGAIYNVIMLSGTDLAVSLYAPYIDDEEAPVVDITLVIRQRWPESSLAVPCLTYWDISSDCKLDNSNDPKSCF